MLMNLITILQNLTLNQRIGVKNIYLSLNYDFLKDLVSISI